MRWRTPASSAETGPSAATAPRQDTHAESPRSIRALGELFVAGGNAATGRLIRRLATGTAGEPSPRFVDRLREEGAGGRMLPDAVRQNLEAGLATPLDRVRVHTGEGAGDLAAGVAARAFTVGQDIYFGRDTYDPDSTDGYQLLAHEVAHTLQPDPGGSLTVGTSDSPAERQADDVAAALTGVPAGNGTLTAAPHRLRRSPLDSSTPAEIKDIRNFAGIDDEQRLRLINILLDQFWVGPSDESALERIWGGMTEEEFVRFAETHQGKWEECMDRGAELLDIAPYRAVQDHFRADITALARHYLKVNEDVAHREIDALGAGGTPPGPDQAARIVALQAAAASLANLQRAQDAAREARVGWRIGDGGDVDPDWTGRHVKYQVAFRPGEAPPLTEEPVDVPNGDVLLYRIVPNDQVQQGYDDATQAITRLVEANPALYGLVRNGSSASTGAFADESDESAARDRLTAPLRRVLTDITATRGRLGDDLDPLDLEPLVNQLFAGGAAVGGTIWTAGFRHHVAINTLVGHAIDRALARAALQYVQQLAILFAPFTSGASLLALLATSTAAAGIQAYGSYRETQVADAAEGSSVVPGTNLVAPGTAEHARLNAEADFIAFGLALLALGAEAFATWRASAQARQLRTEQRLRLSHGTDQTGYQGLGPLDEARIDVAHAGGAHQDLGQGFYLTLDDQGTAGVYAFRRAGQRGGGMQHVLTWEVPASDLGIIVDVRRGGNFRAQWESFLNEAPPFPGGRPLPGFETNRALLSRAPEQRGVIFDQFLGKIGMANADTVLAPLGDDVFTGITSGRETTQVCIRSQRVADRLNAQTRSGR
jgi:hypothetical protein